MARAELTCAAAPECIARRVTDPHTAREAIAAGAGLGFLMEQEAAFIPGLVVAMEPRPEWSADLWLVTHVDLHRTAKVQGFLAHLKATMRPPPA